MNSPIMADDERQLSIHRVLASNPSPHHHLNKWRDCTAQYCSSPFTIEPVRVTYAAGPSHQLGGKSVVTPEFKLREVTLGVDYIRSVPRQYLASTSPVPRQ